MNIVRHWRSAALLAVLGLIFASVMRSAFADPATTPRAGDKANAGRTEVPSTGSDLRSLAPEGTWIGGMGIIEPAAPEQRLGPAVAGRVDAIHVKEGDFVKAGAVLMTLDRSVERAALSAAEAEVRIAAAELSRVSGKTRGADVQAAQRDAEAAVLRAARSQNSYERLRSTVDAGGVSQDALEAARSQSETDQLTARAASSRAASAAASQPADIRLARARHEAAGARRDQAAAALVLREVVAPADGEILQVRPRVGEYIQPGTEAAVVIGDTRRLRARIDIDERDVDWVTQGAKAIVTVDALPAEHFSGEVVEVGRRMGRKNVRSGEPTERIDTKVLEVVVDLGPQDRLIVGQRITGYLAVTP